MFEVVEEMVVWVEVGVVEVEVLVLMLVELVLVTEEVGVPVELVVETEVLAVLELVVVSVSDPVTGSGGDDDWLLSCCPDGPSTQQDGGPGLISRQRLGTDPQVGFLLAGSVFVWAAADLLEVDVIEPPYTCNLVATLPRPSKCQISSAHSRSYASHKAPHPA
ncbi:unnamed protein product [Gadus morhua 'NCC']